MAFVNVQIKMPHKKQILITLGILAYFIVGYLPINALNEARDFYYTPGLPGEEKIPFLAPFILGYLPVYGSAIFIYAIIPSWEIFKKIAWAFFWVTTIHYLFFLVFPVRMIWRPEILEAKNIFEWMAKFVFSLDKPNNCFPSLHVAYPTLAAVLAWRFVPKWRLLFIAMALITAISVVLVKQHYIADALAGAAVSLLVGVWIPRKVSECRSAGVSKPKQ